MIHGFPKRTTFLVDDAHAAAGFYRDVFGMSVWYDDTLPVDARFPPCAPDASPARLIILEANDPDVGKLGFLSYEKFDPEEAPGTRDRSEVRVGDPILVFTAANLDDVHERAVAAGARVVSPPVHWTVPGPDGGTIELYAMSMFDSQGIYSEISQTR